MPALVHENRPGYSDLPRLDPCPRSENVPFNFVPETHWELRTRSVAPAISGFVLQLHGREWFHVEVSHDQIRSLSLIERQVVEHPVSKIAHAHAVVEPLLGDPYEVAFAVEREVSVPRKRY